MRSILNVLLMCGCLSAVASAGANDLAAPASAEDVRQAIETMSYRIGMEVGSEMAQQYIDLDPAAVARGVTDATAGKQPDMDDQEIRKAVMILRRVSQEKIAAIQAKNKTEGEAFLARNKTAEGVKTTASGLQYKVLKSGDGKGKQPTSSDQVTVHYKGTLLDGSEFDSSYKHGQPATFPLGGVIQGWTEGLQLMRVGDKFQLFVPSDLAYGPQGRGKTIPPASVLVFEVELVDVHPAPAQEMPGFPGMPME